MDSGSKDEFLKHENIGDGGTMSRCFNSLAQNIRRSYVQGENQVLLRLKKLWNLKKDKIDEEFTNESGRKSKIL